MTWNGLQTHVWHHLHSLLRHNWQHLWFWDTFLFYSFIFFPVHPYFYLSTMVFTRPNEGWTGLCLKLWLEAFLSQLEDDTEFYAWRATCVLQNVIRGSSSIGTEMAHQLYVLQSLMFNLLEGRRGTEIDINDQVGSGRQARGVTRVRTGPWKSWKVLNLIGPNSRPGNPWILQSSFEKFWI